MIIYLCREVEIDKDDIICDKHSIILLIGFIKKIFVL